MQEFSFAAGISEQSTSPIRNLAFLHIKLRFERGAEYSAMALTPPGVKAFWRPVGAPSWLDWTDPVAVTSACDSGVALEGMLVAQRDSDAELVEPVKLAVKGEPDRVECGCTAAVADMCIVGRWEYDNEAMAEVYTQLADLGLSWVKTTGQLALEIDRASRASFTANRSHETLGRIEVGGPVPIMFGQTNVVEGRGTMRVGSGRARQHHMCVEPEGTQDMRVTTSSTLPDGSAPQVGQLGSGDLTGMLPGKTEVG